MMFYYLITAVQIIVEMLPISSSTHVALACALLGRLTGQSVPAIAEGFDFFLHGPAIVIIVLFFRRDIAQIVRVLWHALFDARVSFSPSTQKYLISMLRLAAYALLAAVMATVARPLLKKLVSLVPLQYGNVVLMGGLLLTAGMLLSLKFAKVGERPQADPLILIGIVQAIALLPGISRLGSTYVAGVWLGLSPRRSLQVSLLYGLVLFCGAFLLKGLPWALTSEAALLHSWPFWAVFITASVVGYAALWALQRAAIAGKMWLFGLYLGVPIAALYFLDFF